MTKPTSPLFDKADGDDLYSRRRDQEFFTPLTPDAARKTSKEKVPETTQDIRPRTPKTDIEAQRNIAKNAREHFNRKKDLLILEFTQVSVNDEYHVWEANTGKYIRIVLTRRVNVPYKMGDKEIIAREFWIATAKKTGKNGKLIPIGLSGSSPYSAQEAIQKLCNRNWFYDTYSGEWFGLGEVKARNCKKRIVGLFSGVKVIFSEQEKNTAPKKTSIFKHAVTGQWAWEKVRERKPNAPEIYIRAPKLLKPSGDANSTSSNDPRKNMLDNWNVEATSNWKYRFTHRRAQLALSDGVIRSDNVRTVLKTRKPQKPFPGWRVGKDGRFNAKLTPLSSKMAVFGHKSPEPENNRKWADSILRVSNENRPWLNNPQPLEENRLVPLWIGIMEMSKE